MPLLFVLLAATTLAPVQERMKSDEVLVAHVVVALCDAETQGVVPPPNLETCDGDVPGKNLYWGALYGVKTHLRRSADWKVVTGEPAPEGVLERAVYEATLDRGGKTVTARIIADAYRGSDMKKAIQQFFRYTAGYDTDAHVVAFVGHNGLMDFDLPEVPKAKKDAKARASIVLACASAPYFEAALKKAGAPPLLLTTGLMAPEAYTLEDAIESWFSGHSAADVHEAAAKAYDRYQKCGMRGARGLFKSPEYR